MSTESSGFTEERSSTIAVTPACLSTRRQRSRDDSFHSVTGASLSMWAQTAITHNGYASRQMRDATRLLSGNMADHS